MYGRGLFFRIAYVKIYCKKRKKIKISIVNINRIIMKREYKIYKKNGRSYVLVKVKRTEESGLPEANFDSTFFALSGVLLPGETLEQWLERRQITIKKYNSLR